MGLLMKLNKDLVESMKNKDVIKTNTIRSVKTAIKTVQIEKKTTEDLNDVDIIQVIKKQAKQRNDSIEIYLKGNRNDLAEKEQQELDVLKTYLPQEADENKINEILMSLEITNMGDMIKKSKDIINNLGYTVDGKLLSELVKNKLK